MFKSISKVLTKEDHYISYVASAMGILASLSFIEVIISNLNDQSHIFIQPLIIFVNSIFWTLHGIARKDWALVTPNAIAIILSLTAAVLAFV